MQENIASEARSAKTDTSLAEARYYYAKGQTGIGEFMLRYAIETAKIRNERITPQEVGDIMNSGKRKPDTGYEAQKNMQQCAQNLRQELSQILVPFNAIKEAIAEMSNKLLALVENLLAQQIPAEKVS